MGCAGQANVAVMGAYPQCHALATAWQRAGFAVPSERVLVQDPDSTVRDAAAESLGCIAGGLAIHSERTVRQPAASPECMLAVAITGMGSGSGLSPP